MFKRLVREVWGFIRTGGITLFLWPSDDDELVEALWGATSRDEIRRLLAARNIQDERHGK